jgi:radical SAM protein with 4Fe4S-binding SPASM domain
MRPPKLTVTVSTDGDEIINDYVRGIKGGWRRQIETYKQLYSIPGISVFLGMTVSSLNAGEYDRAFAAAKVECPWLEPTNFHMNIAHESGHYYGNQGSGLRSASKDQIVEQVRHYRNLRGVPMSPISGIEHRYLKYAEQYLRTGVTPMRCHALYSSCFVDSWGDVYPCGMYDAKIASLREFDFDLETIWNLPKTRRLQHEIWDYRCPQCWTPCEAYQSILGNLLGQRNTETSDNRAVATSVSGDK